MTCANGLVPAPSTAICYADNTWNLPKCVCGPGAYAANAGCHACPLGKFSTVLDAADASVCTFCAVGKQFTSKSTPCESCPPGSSQVQDNVASAKCQACVEGKFIDSVSTASGHSCAICGKNTFSHAGADHCKPCAPGSTSVPGSASCTCAKGFGRDPLASDASTAAELCGEGFYTGVATSYTTFAISMGSSEAPEKSASFQKPQGSSIQSILSCPPIVSKFNWNSMARLNDTFVVSTNQTTVTVVRRDASSGWGMDLNFDCSIVSPSCVKCKFSSKCPFFSCFFCLMLSFSFFFVAFLTLFFFLFYLLNKNNIGPSGKYRAKGDGDFGARCLSCSTGRVSSTLGAVSAAACSFCPKGTYFNRNSQSGSACESCVSGQYQDQDSTLVTSGCKKCPPGKSTLSHTATSFDSCTDCPLGRFEYSNTRICTDCGSGTYQNETGTIRCKRCPTGKYSTGLGKMSSSACAFCSVGDYFVSSSTSCKSCEAGKYQDQGNAAVVTCKNCPSGKTSSARSTSSSSCVFCSAQPE